MIVLAWVFISATQIFAVPDFQDCETIRKLHGSGECKSMKVFVTKPTIELKK